ncbi:helix-turn-helix transcriptional regulator [Streptomyces venezuelae]|uniref:helix-turn-helix domain-containing protein n=1 Tax=Streptomyces venezuelae TaxID=54571 RepID=UPI003451C7FB
MGTRTGTETGAGADSLAELLRELKERSGLSYGVLARRLHLSTSAVHRYCSGDAVPPAYVTVERFARLCGASPRELVETHRLWVLADADRGPRSERSDALGGPGGPGVPEAVPAVVAISPSPTDPSPPVPSPAFPFPYVRRPFLFPYVRRRTLVLAGVAAAVFGLGAATVVLHDSDDGERQTQQHVPGPTAPPLRGTSSPSASDRPGRGADTDRPDTGTSSRADGKGKDGDGKDGNDRKGRQGGPSASPHEKSDRDRSTTGPSHGGGKGTGPDGGRSKAPVTPLTTRVRPFLYEGCVHEFLVNRAPGAVPEPPAEQDVPAWVGELGAVSARRQYIEVTVQGTGKDPVVLDSMDVRVRSSNPPLAWNNFAIPTRCDDQIYAKSFTVDLDEAVPRATPVTGQPDFPYEVSESDPQVFLVTAGTALHDVRWHMDLKWSSGRRHGVLRIDDQGKPFRTSGYTGRPTYTWLGSDGWGTEPP